jgi:hypothetical protein
MKKLLPLLVISILVLGGFGAVAIPNEKQIQDKQLRIDHESLEIKVKGILFGYKVTVTNVGNESVSGNFSMNITTDALIMLRGEELEQTVPFIGLGPNDSKEFWMGPVIGFGRALISALAILDNLIPIKYSKEANGFVLLIYVSGNMVLDPLFG